MHSVLNQYRIHSVTLRSVPARNQRGSWNRQADYSQTAPRLVESTLRSLNNVLERFHQSYFFYLLPHARHFISILFFFPVIGVFMLGLLLYQRNAW